jgi:hypothetical protein
MGKYAIMYRLTSEKFTLFKKNIMENELDIYLLKLFKKIDINNFEEIYVFYYENEGEYKFRRDLNNKGVICNGEGK